MKLYQSARGLGRATGVLFLAALGLWAAGILLPVLKVTELFIFENDITLLSATIGLLREGEIGIGLLVLVFTLILPPAKLLLGLGLWRLARQDGKAARRGIVVLDFIGKWAMADVLILALVVVTLKSNWIARAETDIGLYCFAASALLAVAAGLGLKKVMAPRPE